MKKEDEVTKDYLLKIINKYLNGNSTVEEEKLLINYYESFQGEKEWNAELGLEEDIKYRIHEKILSKIKKPIEKEPKVIQLNFKKYLKYAVVILIFISTGYYLTINNFFNSASNVEVRNTIKIGSDKATLTLEDGSVVFLEKGKEYNLTNAKSDGEKLVYLLKEDENTSPVVNKTTYNYLTVPRGGVFYVTLADGTNVWLNSESQLKYPVAFVEGKTRQVELIYGEAYFDVSHSTENQGSKFKVKTKNQEIEVLGTQFNISAYRDENYIYTTLVEGKILVTNGNQHAFLLPNQQSIVTLNTKTINVFDTDVFSAILWREGIFSFENFSLEKIAKVLSRWYDVDFIFSNAKLKNQKFSGILRKNQNIEEILKIINNTNNINYEIDNKTIVLK